MLEMTAYSVGLLDDGVHAQLRDFVDEPIFITFAVLHNYGRQMALVSYFKFLKARHGNVGMLTVFQP